MAESAVTLTVQPQLDPESVDQIREQTKQTVLDGIRGGMAVLAGVIGALAELNTPTDPESATGARGVDLEIWEELRAENIDSPGVIVPRRIKINGIEILTPADKSIIELSPIDGKNCVTANLNVLVRSLKIHPVETDAAS